VLRISVMSSVHLFTHTHTERQIRQHLEVNIQMNPETVVSLLTGHTVLCVQCLRQHLSYDGCLEARREIIRTVLCCIVYWSCAQP